jgi:hypothetical protein
MRGRAIGVVLLLALAGCETPGPEPTDRRFGQTPAYDVRTATVRGAPVFRQSVFDSTAGAATAAPLSASVALQSVRIPAGTDLTGMRTSDATWFCTAGPAVFALAGAPTGPACLRDDDQDGAFDTVMSPSDPLVRGAIGPVPYRRTDRAGGVRYAQEILFDGVEDGRIRLRYRETAADGAGPGVEEAFEAPLAAAGDTPVAFRRFRMTVHDATPERLEATVRAGF